MAKKKTDRNGKAIDLLQQLAPRPNRMKQKKPRPSMEELHDACFRVMWPLCELSGDMASTLVVGETALGALSEEFQTLCQLDQLPYDQMVKWTDVLDGLKNMLAQCRRQINMAYDAAEAQSDKLKKYFHPLTAAEEKAA